MTLNHPIDLTHVTACERCGSPMTGLSASELQMCGFCINELHELEEEVKNDFSIYYERHSEIYVPPADGHPIDVARTGKAPDSADVQPNNMFGQRLRNNRNRRS